MRRFTALGGFVALLALVLATSTSASSSNRQVVVRDDCDPATFDAALDDPNACVKDGSTTFQEFVGQLITQGRAPAWRFAPDHLGLSTGGTIDAVNRGGEAHTFTEVASFGGGCIDFLNGLLGLSRVPECAGFDTGEGAFFDTFVPAGGTLPTDSLSAGIHRFECLIHPWMRTTVNVG
jgi:plastocyanin